MSINSSCWYNEQPEIGQTWASRTISVEEKLLQDLQLWKYPELGEIENRQIQINIAMRLYNGQEVDITEEKKCYW